MVAGGRDQEAAGRQLIRLHHLTNGVHRVEGDASALRRLPDRGRRTLPEPGLEAVDQLLALVRALRSAGHPDDRGEARVVAPVGVLHQIDELVPVAVQHRVGGEVAVVAGEETPVHGAETPARALRRGPAPVDDDRKAVSGDGGGHRLEHADVDELPATAAVAMHERERDRGGGVESAVLELRLVEGCGQRLTLRVADAEGNTGAGVRLEGVAHASWRRARSNRRG